LSLSLPLHMKLSFQNHTTLYVVSMAANFVMRSGLYCVVYVFCNRFVVWFSVSVFSYTSSEVITLSDWWISLWLSLIFFLAKLTYILINCLLLNYKVKFVFIPVCGKLTLNVPQAQPTITLIFAYFYQSWCVDWLVISCLKAGFSNCMRNVQSF